MIDEIFGVNKDIFTNISKILIELQPKINNKMKFVSHIIYGKFVELYKEYPSVQIRFVRATQKLKCYNGPIVECTLKGEYARGKYLSVKYVEWLLQRYGDNEKNWKSWFDSLSKKDDAADCMLFAISNLNSKKLKDTI